jgi:gliding motility-associated lipoprotein GldD
MSIGMLFSVGCTETYTPRPRGYFRIDFPDKEYLVYQSACDFSFEYPRYGKVLPDSGPMAEPCWLNLGFDEYNAKIHLSYKLVNHNLGMFIEDAHLLAYKHAVKADAINERMFTHEEKNVHGILYEIRGNAASPAQFFVTDSVRHFLRGSLYISATPNRDSLNPVIDFFIEDVMHLIETVEWK